MKLTKRYVERESAKMFIDGINLATAKANGKKHLVEVKEKPHRLFFVLKKVWYDQIASGQKTVEYRAMTPYWAKRLQRAIFAYNNGIDLKDWTVTPVWGIQGSAQTSCDTSRRLILVSVPTRDGQGTITGFTLRR